MLLNQKVKGKYCGVSFEGTIASIRRLTVKTDDCFEYDIILDNSVEIFGEERSFITLYARFDGTPSSYTGFHDYMETLE